MKSSQSTTKVLRDIPPHFFRHVFSGLIVFALCVVTDVFVAEYFVRPLKHELNPGLLKVHWQDGTVSEVDPNKNISTNSAAGVVIGMRSDGVVVWRDKQ